VGDEIGGRLWAASSQRDVDESGDDADEQAMKNKLRIEAAADPDGEDKTGQQGSGRRRVSQGALAEEQGDWKDEGDYGNFSE
jgi:hypothetical protein